MLTSLVYGEFKIGIDVCLGVSEKGSQRRWRGGDRLSWALKGEGEFLRWERDGNSWQKQWRVRVNAWGVAGEQRDAWL